MKKMSISISATPFKVGDIFLDPNIGTAVRITGDKIKEVVRYGVSAYFVDVEYIFAYGKPHQNIGGQTEVMLGTSEYGVIQWYGPATYRPTWGLNRMLLYIGNIYPQSEILDTTDSYVLFVTGNGEYREYRKERRCWDLYKTRYNKI